MLIAYFQSYVKKLKYGFAQGAKVLGISWKKELSDTFKNASEHIHDFIKMEKPTPQGYRFMVSESILTAMDLLLPEHIKKLVYGGSEGMWSKLSNRIVRDVQGQLARRMNLRAVDIEVSVA